MAVKTISCNDYLTATQYSLVLDVRSESEYNQAHIPGAIHLPLFNDEERKIVGTAYKQESREVAIRIGLDYFGPKMRAMVETVEHLVKDRADKEARPGVLLYCWRGGMRSAGVAWLLDLYGFDVSTLRGGYKSFRKHVLDALQQPYHFKIIGGYTGSGKTDLLTYMRAIGKAVIDLEALAAHRGSALGALENKSQPRQEMFENLLFVELNNLVGRFGGAEICIEDESQRIGNLQIPQGIWKQLREADVYFIDVPFEVRLQNLVKHYGMQQKQRLTDAVLRIQKRLGGSETKTTLKLLTEDNITEAFRILLKYYDKYYRKALDKRGAKADKLHKLHSATVDPEQNYRLLQMHCK